MLSAKLVVALLFVSASALAAQKQVKPLDRPREFSEDETDKMTGTARLTSQASTLSGLQTLGGRFVAVTWGRVITSQADTLYKATLTYGGEDWLFIKTQEKALDLLIDGTREGFEAVGRPYREVGSGGKVYEAVTVPMTLEHLFTIARADSITWRVYGDKGWIGGDAKSSNFDRLRRFLKTLFPDSSLVERK